MAKTESLQLNKKLTALVLMVSVFLTSVVSVAAYSRTAIIKDGAKATEISTSCIFTEQILSEANVTLGENDETERTNEDGVTIINVLRAFDVRIIDNGTEQTVQMAKGTVAQALDKAGIVPADTDGVEPSLDTEVSKDTVIKVAPKCTISITADGKTTKKTVLQLSVKEAVENAGVKLNGMDIVSPEPDSMVTDGMSITVKRVTVKEVKTTQAVSFKSVEKESSDLYTGETKVSVQGKNGEKTITKQETYVDGKLQKTEVVSTEVTKQPQDKVTLIGTKQRPCSTVSENDAEGSFVDADGNKVFYSSIIVGTATAYNESEGSLTATGVPVYYGGVAVDPSIIPYGSKLYIASNDGAYVYGYATAVDTGGAMLSGAALIDLFYNSESECEQFGRRTVTVYIL